MTEATKQAQHAYRDVGLLDFMATCLFFLFYFIYLFLILFIYFISWRLITLQYCSGFCHTLT